MVPEEDHPYWNLDASSHKAGAHDRLGGDEDIAEGRNRVRRPQDGTLSEALLILAKTHQELRARSSRRRPFGVDHFLAKTHQGCV